MTEENDERFFPYAPMGTSVQTEPKPIDSVPRKSPEYNAYKTHALHHRKLKKLAGTDTLVTITAANDDILNWQADMDCYVVWIDTSGTQNDRKILLRDGEVFTTAYVLANTNIRFEAEGGRPYLFYLKKGDRVIVRSGTAAAGDHTAHIIGFYAHEG